MDGLIYLLERRCGGTLCLTLQPVLMIRNKATSSGDPPPTLEPQLAWLSPGHLPYAQEPEMLHFSIPILETSGEIPMVFLVSPGCIRSSRA